MEKNAGYEIRESVLFDNGRGFALGEMTERPLPLSHGSLPRRTATGIIFGATTTRRKQQPSRTLQPGLRIISGATVCRR